MACVDQRLKSTAVGTTLTILLVAVGVSVGHALGINDVVEVLVLAFVGATAAGVVGVKRQM
jgi:hypothetical protein